jgi:hypothetical protein
MFDFRACLNQIAALVAADAALGAVERAATDRRIKIAWSIFWLKIAGFLVRTSTLAQSHFTEYVYASVGQHAYIKPRVDRPRQNLAWNLGEVPRQDFPIVEDDADRCCCDTSSVTDIGNVCLEPAGQTTHARIWQLPICQTNISLRLSL